MKENNMRKKNPMEKLSFNLEEAFIKNNYANSLVPERESPGMFSRLINYAKENPKTTAGLLGVGLGAGLGLDDLLTANHDLDNDLSHLPKGSKFDPDNIKMNVLKTRMDNYDKLFDPLKIYDKNNDGFLDSREIINANKIIDNKIAQYNNEHPIKNHVVTSEPEHMKNNLSNYKKTLSTFDLDKNGVVPNRDIDLGKDLLHKNDVKLNPIFKGLGYGAGGLGLTAAIQYGQNKLGGSNGKS